MTVLFLNWVGYNSHFQNYFMFNPSLYFVLEIIKHVPKIPKIFLGGFALSDPIFVYRSWKTCIELETVYKLNIWLFKKKYHPIWTNPKIGVRGGSSYCTSTVKGGLLFNHPLNFLKTCWKRGGYYLIGGCYLTRHCTCF